MMVNAAYFICLQYGSEIFPTVIRGQGVALCEIVGGFAIFLSPTVVYLVKPFLHKISVWTSLYVLSVQAKVSSILPLLIFGLCSTIGALATFFLPETAGQTLPQTLADGAEFGRNDSRLDCFCLKRNQHIVAVEKVVDMEQE